MALSFPTCSQKQAQTLPCSGSLRPAGAGSARSAAGLLQFSAFTLCDPEAERAPRFFLCLRRPGMLPGATCLTSLAWKMAKFAPSPVHKVCPKDWLDTACGGAAGAQVQRGGVQPPAMGSASTYLRQRRHRAVKVAMNAILQILEAKPKPGTHIPSGRESCPRATQPSSVAGGKAEETRHGEEVGK